MKLVRFGPVGAEKPGVFGADSRIHDLSGIVGDIAGETLSDAGLKTIAAADLSSLPVVDPDTRLGACVAATGKFICIGLNYADHASESGMAVPPEPATPRTCACG